MNDLFHFLTDIATNPQKQAEFVKQPHIVMMTAGLSPSDQAVIESHDNRRIVDTFIDEKVVPLSACCLEPGPDPLPDPDPPYPYQNLH